VEDPSEKKKPVESAKKSDLGAALAAHAESQTVAFNQSKGHDKSNPDDDKDRKAVKAAILASSVMEESGDSADEGNDNGAAGNGNCDDLMAQNTNAESVSKAQTEQREKSKEAAQAKKDKDKEDREKQKKDGEDRKKKAQEKASKGERKR